MKIGEYQHLRVIGESEHGLFLGDGASKVLLPNNQCPDDLLIRDSIEVFIYTDSEDRPVATTDRPYGIVGDFVVLRCVGTTRHGAFLNWGLAKDLFCPIREQHFPMLEGADYLVRIYLDPVSNRVACSTRVERYLSTDGSEFEPGQKVSIMVADFTDDFIAVIVEGRVKASIFPDEWHESLELGEVRDAYIKRIRGDGKVAISLRPQGYQAVIGERDRILSALRENGGSLPVSDKSSPEEIHRRFGLSKGAFKKLIGGLMKEGLIDIEPQSIRLKS
ncbi:MAG: GntR family transcriptional regulator [Armatimonadetes bacterium]|nr:GntR family transcriptional regulator [Armatimonadota bacterium]